jgi:hypothetical protein
MIAITDIEDNLADGSWDLGKLDALIEGVAHQIDELEAKHNGLKQYAEALDVLRDNTTDAPAAVAYAYRKGFRETGRDEDGTVYMTKVIGPSRRYVEIDPDGLANGENDYKSEIDILAER